MTDTNAIIHATRLPGERPLVLGGHRVFHPVAKGPHHYHAAFARLWNGGDSSTGSAGTIVNVEHDMEVSPSLVTELLSCPHALCTHAYRMHTPRSFWAHGWKPDDARGARGEGIRWIDQGDEWADYSAIGFCKIAREARTVALGRCEWPAVELAVNNAVTGRWHVHWGADGQGIEHDHREPR